MRKLFLTLAVVCFIVGLVRSAPKKAHKYRKAVECTVRNGLPNFFKKLKEGKEVKIAYLGGSITCQPGYRVKSLKWFKEQFPKAKIREIHAGIGGTPSTLGAYRVKQDVLRFKPDLLFVEFAVNDHYMSQASIVKSMEGIVRQTLKADPKTDICFVYTFAARDLPLLQNDKFQHTASAMEEVADHYGIPTIHMGYDVAKLIKEGKVLMKAPKAKVEQVAGGDLNKLKAGNKVKPGAPIPFSGDGVHPYTDTGHQFYMNAIERSMKKIETVGKPGAHKLPAPLDKKCMENVKIEPVEKVKKSAGWKQLSKKDRMGRFLNRFQTIWQASKPGEKISFKFKGTACKIYDILGPNCGVVAISVDGKPAKERARMDKYCGYHRIATLWVASNLKDDVHTVEIELLDKEPDRKKILSPRNVKKMEANPDQFKGTNWYIGGIMLDGDLVD